jgi:hypothetical protein
MAPPDSAPAVAAKEPEVAFDASSQEISIDFRACSQLPFDPDTGGVKAFRAIVFPKGKGVHVPKQAGRMVIAGEWAKQEALCLVHFVPSTQREPELLINFVDYGYANPTMNGVSVESLQLPLAVKKHVYQDTPRMTRIENVCGFTPIDASKAPWSIHLKPCLQKLPQFKTLGISSPKDISTWLKSEIMELRVRKLESMARSALDEEMKSLMRQDKSQGEKQKTIFESKLSTILSAIAALPPSSYDTSLKNRITILRETDEQPEWLRSPEQRALKDGTSAFVKTRLLGGGAETLAAQDATRVEALPFAVEGLDGLDDEPPAAAAAATAEGGAETVEASAVALSDGDNSDMDEMPIGLPMKRSRSATKPFVAGAASAVKKLKGGAKRAASTPDLGINPRTNKPYVRGAYNTKPSAEKTGVDALKQEAKLKKKQAQDSAATLAQADEIRRLKSDLKDSRLEVARLTEALAAAKSATALEVAKVRAEVKADMQSDMMVQFQRGLAAGASLSQGKPFNIDSPGMGGAGLGL